MPNYVILWFKCQNFKILNEEPGDDSLRDYKERALMFIVRLLRQRFTIIHSD